MGETQAARFHRVIVLKRDENHADTCLLRAFRHLAEEPGGQQASQRVLDILASWRTCGTCSGAREFEGIAPRHSSTGPMMHMCGRQESPCYSSTLDLTKDTCGHWEEKTDG